MFLREVAGFLTEGLLQQKVLTQAILAVQYTHDNYIPSVMTPVNLYSMSALTPSSWSVALTTPMMEPAIAPSVTVKSALPVSNIGELSLTSVTDTISCIKKGDKGKT